MGRRIAIVGSRDYPHPERVRQYVRDIFEPDDMLISGHGGAVDLVAENEAAIQHLPYLIFPAQWDRWGRKAGAIRNRRIVAECDRLVAFWDGKSKGTKMIVDMAETAGKGLMLFNDGPHAVNNTLPREEK